ncbi:cysteine hydrolase family protein [Pseudarthrobacter sulfonivorans]|uniref:cysteine hydrolase family protein n=1 Tax=Pseudarthrobacter sulfonivorans TaxID=121292 RepID=UPI00168B48D3|nr:cysteine hydrolase [Pseudarthrobacter sulfonivorans]
MTPKLDPKNTALLLMDYQASTLGFLAEARPLVSSTADVAAAVRAGGGAVGFVRVGFTDEDYVGFPDGHIMGDRVKAGRPGMDADSPTTALHEALNVQDGDIVVRKTRVSAFSTTDLHEQLTNAGITTLILAGVHTSGVVLTTVREAHDLDYRVIVLSDACADPDETIHSFLMEKIFPKQAKVLTIAEVQSALPVGNPSR